MKKISDILPNGLPAEPDDGTMEKMAPLLHSVSKENPFPVPENYFDELPSQIMNRCREEAVKSKRPSVLEKLRIYILGYKWRFLLATCCLAIICFMIMPRNSRPIPYETLANTIPDSLIVAHFDKNITDVNLYALEDISAENSAGQEEGNASPSAKNASDSANTDQAIIAYLMNTNISISEIEN